MPETTTAPPRDERAISAAIDAAFAAQAAQDHAKTAVATAELLAVVATSPGRREHTETREVTIPRPGIVLAHPNDPDGERMVVTAVRVTETRTVGEPDEPYRDVEVYQRAATRDGKPNSRRSAWWRSMPSAMFEPMAAALGLDADQ